MRNRDNFSTHNDKIWDPENNMLTQEEPPGLLNSLYVLQISPAHFVHLYMIGLLLKIDAS